MTDSRAIESSPRGTTATLTSLAMLKINVDQGRDYLDYLNPFVLQILASEKPNPVTDRVICDHLRTTFGLEIPSRAVQVVLKRLSRLYKLEKSAGVYRITEAIPDPGIAIAQADAHRHINSVAFHLQEFSKGTNRVLKSPESAIHAICEFLAEFDISCLRAYVRGTVIPPLSGTMDSSKVLVSRYVLHLQEAKPERFDSFMVMVQGHMLANALLCPDLQDAPKSYKHITFFLDTPLLVRMLDLEGEHRRAAIDSLIELLRSLGGRIATFAHLQEELERVVTGAASFVESPEGRGSIVFEAQRRGTTKSDLLLKAGQIDKFLQDAAVKIQECPPYARDLQINEVAFDEVLQDEIDYFNPRAREYDVNSLRSIYVLRGNSSPTCLEKAGAVLVTSNAAFARAAYNYGKQHEQANAISAVITDFSLANMAWLKAPIGAPSVPRTEVLAFSYAAVQPSRDFLTKYLREIEKLEHHGKISKSDHQLLRSSTLAQDEMMELTLGSEEALTEETVTETLRRVSDEIKEPVNADLAAERQAHNTTRSDLETAREREDDLRKKLFWRYSRYADWCAWAASILLVIAVILGLTFGSGVIGAFIIFIVLTLLSLFFGTNVKKVHGWVRAKCLTWLLKRASASLGLDLHDHRS